ncbi:MAG TPA: hypothetical protein VL856_16350, partial [Acidimicrobiia bacterium]|nr:hypothetical protein [Acidimicrobiia bacterium]
MILLVALGALLIWIPVYFVLKAYAPVSAEDVRALHVLTGVPTTPRSDRLFEAYLSRARRYRTSWSVVGWLSGLIFTFTVGNNRVGFGPGARATDLLLLGLGGYLLGAIVSEIHHLRRPRVLPTVRTPPPVRRWGERPRVASLRPRRLDDYATRTERRLMRLMLVVTLGLGIAGVVEDRPAAVIVTVIAVAAWAIVERTQRAVVFRPRPAMSDDLAAADDGIRAMAVKGLSYGGAAFIALLGAYAASIIGRDSVWDNEFVSVLLAIAGLA